VKYIIIDFSATSYQWEQPRAKTLEKKASEPRRKNQEKNEQNKTYYLVRCATNSREESLLCLYVHYSDTIYNIHKSRNLREVMEMFTTNI